MNCLEVIKKRNEAAVTKNLEHQNEMWQRGFEAGYVRALQEMAERQDVLGVRVDPASVERFIAIGRKPWQQVTELEKKEYKKLEWVFCCAVQNAYEVQTARQ